MSDIVITKTSMKHTTETHSDKVLREEAQVWLRRLTSGNVTEWDAQAFKRWQATSAAHANAFIEAKRHWKMMGPVIGNMLRADPKTAALHARTMQKNKTGRRAFIGGLISAGAVAGVAVVHPPFGLWSSPDTWGADYTTAVGQQHSVAFNDAAVTLNTKTSIRRLAETHVTGIELLSGEAAIDLTGNGKTFDVLAGKGRSHAESGRFEVRYVDGRICVTCMQGAVRVVHPAGERLLQAQQQTVYDAHSVSGVASVDTGIVSAWRSGELVFKQTPLAQVVNEINRYRAGHVVLANTAMNITRVSGRFMIANLDAALLQLQHSFNLQARSLPGGMLILS